MYLGETTYNKSYIIIKSAKIVPYYEYEYEKLPIDILLGSGTFRKDFIENGEL